MATTPIGRRQRTEDQAGRDAALVRETALKAELARREAENRALIARQAASAEVLKTISASPDDTRPVFAMIARHARALCEAQTGSVLEYDGALLHMRVLEGHDPAASERMRRAFPRPPGPETIAGRVVLDGLVIHVRDPAEHPEFMQAARHLNSQSLLGVPLLRERQAIGAIVLSRFEAGGFDDAQIALVESFAAQAAIAIENARLITAQREALEQQTATAEVLQVINASPGDLTAVFDAVLEKAMRLCDAPAGNLMTYDGKHFRAGAVRGSLRQVREYVAPEPGTALKQVADGDRVVHIPDLVDTDAYRDRVRSRVMLVEHHGARTALWVALRKDEAVKGIIILFRREARAFSDKEIALVQTFAEQAVIAMENARLLGELQERTAALAARNNDFGEQIAHQSATIDVLKAMSTSAADPQPIFELIVHRAWLLCDCRAAALFEYDGRLLYQRARSGFGDPAKKDAFARLFPMPAETDTVAGRVILSRQIVNIADAHDDLALHAAVRDLHAGSLLGVPMLRDGRPVGAIAMNARTTGGFSDSQIELLKTFAEQAVIAIGSAETYRELQERTAALAARNSEFGERIGQQSATIDVLKAMSASANDTQPVFDLITRRARELCGTAASMLFEFDGDLLHLRSWGGWDPAAAEGYLKQFPMRPDCSTANGRAILERRIIHIRDVARDTALGPTVRAMGVGSTIAVPLMRNDRPLGSIALGLPVSGGFSDNQVELLQTFAEQAVIAIGSVATFNELQARTAALARSVDELQALETVLRAVNSSLDIDTVLDTIISRAVQLSQADEGTIYEFDQHQEVFVPKSAVGMSAERVEALRERRIRIGETPLGQSAAMRAPLHIPDLTMTPDDTGLVAAGIHAVLAVPLLREDTLVGGLVIRRRSAGGFGATIPTLLQTFAGQAVLAIENAGLFREARRARAEAETTLADLRRTQDRLVQTEKMASLGQLTAGIAHEIKNPLNFVNNFSDLSTDLLDELNAALTPEKLDMAADLRAEIDDLTAMLKGNLQRIAEHGRRADSIVKNMLLHSRAGSGERRPVDVNSTAEEALNLAYHGARAETPGFNITLEKDLDPGAGQSEMFPQEIVRVLVNLIGNGFYAARKRAERTGTAGFEPTLRLATRDLGTHVEIRVRDNGTGIPDTVRERIFEPFFTTKPAGEGTGLGLSLSYDIVVKQHGGQLTVDSRPDAFTEFVITLPRRARAGAAA